MRFILKLVRGHEELGSLGEFDLSDEGFGDAGAFRVSRVDGESDAANVRGLFAENSPERVGNREVNRNGRIQLRAFDADEASTGVMVAPLEGVLVASVSQR